MSHKYVLDSFAWVEYFRGTKKGETVKECLEEGGCITPTIVLAELSDVYEREGNSHWERDFAFILSKTTISDLDKETASEAGKIKNEVKRQQEPKFGLADAIVLATARKLAAKVLTGDQHFKKLPGTVLI